MTRSVKGVVFMSVICVSVCLCFSIVYCLTALIWKSFCFVCCFASYFQFLNFCILMLWFCVRRMTVEYFSSNFVIIASFTVF
jgi:hypothetical protein